MRRLLLEFLVNFGLAFTGLIMVVTLGTMFEELNRVLKYQPPVWAAGAYFALKIPLLVSMSMPLAVLLGVLFTLAGMLRSHEMVAMRAGGISQYAIAAPFLASAFLISLLTIVWGEIVVPYANAKRVAVKRTYILKQIVPSWKLAHKVGVWTARGQLVYAELANAGEGLLRDVIIMDFDGINPVGRVDASLARPIKGAWELENMQSYRWKNGQPSLRQRKKAVYPIAEGMEDIIFEGKPAETQTMADLKRSIEQLKRTGQDYGAEQVFYHLKWSYPFASFIVALLAVGISFSMQTNPRDGPARAFGVAIVTAGGYIVLQQLGQTFGIGGVVGPVVATWTPNVVFLAIGIYLLWKGWRH
jgi:lipopolysaccharide export system permease protein